MKTRALAVAAIAVLGGCNGAGGTVPHVGSFVRGATVSATPQPLIFVGMSVKGQSGIGEFRRSANGNVKPVRTKAFTDAVVSLFGADDSNNFWVLFHKRNTFDPPTLYAVRYSSKFVSLGTVMVDEQSSTTVDSKGNVYAVTGTDTIEEYAAGSYGKRTLRQLNLPCCMVSAPLLATDASGNLYASSYPGSYNESQLSIAEWGHKGSGSVVPKKLLSTGTATPSELLADAAGDVFATFGGPYSAASGIWEWPAASTTPQWILSGLPMKAFALDSAGDIYAEVPTIENNFAIEVFTPGGDPIATIAGPKTRLGYPNGITVAP